MLFKVIHFMVFSGYFLHGFCAQITIKTSFSCENRPTGYYADMEAGCQVYHMCDNLGRQFSYSCPNATLFQQRMLICDHWYMVDCKKSEDNYRANLLIGQRDKPFVDESEKNLYYRTPRPDILTNTPIPEYNVIYRNGKAQTNAFSLRNLMRHNKDGQINLSSTTENTPNPVPSHPTTSYEQNKIPKRFRFEDNTKTKSYSNTPQEDPLPNHLNEVTEQPTKTPLSGRRLDYDLSNQDGVFPKKTNGPSSTYPQKFKINNEKSLKELQKLYYIPDFLFPLDTATRPSYENGKSSFDNTPNLLVKY